MKGWGTNVTGSADKEATNLGQLGRKVVSG